MGSAGDARNGIGAFRLDMVELPPALFGRRRSWRSTPRAASLAEAGTRRPPSRAASSARMTSSRSGRSSPTFAEGRDPASITVFKSVGLAIQDVAAAGLVAERLVGGG